MSSADAATATTTAPAKFLTGNMLGHVITMTVSASIGLMAVFAVDVLNLYYIAQLGVTEFVAAVGFASNLQFFYISLSLGMSIATGAIVARALGQGQAQKAKSLAGTALIYSFGLMLLLTLITLPLFPWFIELMGARGETADIAVRYMHISMISVPILSVGMALSGVLRAVGDARRSMFVTLIGGVVAFVVDPILILWMDLGVDGAAIATVLSRTGIALYGIWAVVRVHRLVAMPNLQLFKDVWAPFWKIGGPAVATQLATPFGNAYVTAAISPYGDDAVAGWTIVGRLLPLAFGALFALSGAVGPIIGQNFGAQNRERILLALRESLLFCIIYVLFVWALLAIGANWINASFGGVGLGAELVIAFCTVVAGTFMFHGILFVANAAFNNLGYALYSTAFNWGRATIGTIPFVYFGGLWYGAVGVLYGWGIGVVAFGVASIFVAFRTVRTMDMSKDDLAAIGEEDAAK